MPKPKELVRIEWGECAIVMFEGGVEIEHPDGRWLDVTIEELGQMVDDYFEAQKGKT